MTKLLPTARLAIEDTEIEAVVRDARPDVRHQFEQLAPDQRAQLAVDAWTIGLRAMSNAHAQAQEARLTDVSRTLLEDLDTQLAEHVRQQEATLTARLRHYFDPADGQLAERMRVFIDDQGALAKLLDRYVGPQNSVLAETLARQVGEQSVLFRKLSPTDSEAWSRHSRNASTRPWPPTTAACSERSTRWPRTERLRGSSSSSRSIWLPRTGPMPSNWQRR